jgi:hypothetical protein
LPNSLKGEDPVFLPLPDCCRPAAKGEAASAPAFDFRELLPAEKPHAMFRNWRPRRGSRFLIQLVALDGSVADPMV